MDDLQLCNVEAFAIVDQRKPDGGARRPTSRSVQRGIPPRSGSDLSQVNYTYDQVSSGVPHVSFSETWDSTNAAILSL